MEEIIASHSRDGIVARKALVAAGVTRKELAGAEATGVLTPVGRGLFAAADADPGVVAAVRSGGSLTCLSALRLLGIWTFYDSGQHHIRRPERRRRAGQVDGALECRSTLAHRRTPLDSLDAAMVAVLLNHSPEHGALALDCVLNRRLRDRASLAQLLDTAPKYAQRLLGQASGLVESPLESLVRFRLWQRKVKVTCQVTIPGVGRVDMLVGRRLILELDGLAYHGDREQFAADRRRDRTATAKGYKVLRYTWDDVTKQWPVALAEILAFVSADSHRRAPRP